MAKKNAYDSKADVIDLTTPETTIIDLTEIVQPARKPADTAEIDFNDELTDFIGKDGVLDAQPELDSLLSDLGGSVEDAAGSASARAGASSDFAGVMENAAASLPEADPVGALIDDLNPPPSGSASDADGEGSPAELDSLLDSLFSSPAATRITSATEEATAASSAGPIPSASGTAEAGSGEAGVSSVAEDVFGDLDSLLDGLDGPAAAPAAAPVSASGAGPERGAPAPDAKPSAAKPSPAPQASKAADPVEDAFPDLDALLEGLDDLDGPAAAPASASEAGPERGAPAPDVKPSAAKPSSAPQASKAECSAKDIFADFDSLLNGVDIPDTAAAAPEPVLPEQAPVPEPEGDVLDELDLLLDGSEGQPDLPVKHDDTAEIDAILDEALLPNDAPVEQTAPLLESLLPDEESAGTLPAEARATDEEASGAALAGVCPERAESGAALSRREQPDRNNAAEPSADPVSEPLSEEADLSGNPEEVLRNIDELLEAAPDEPLAPDKRAAEPWEEREARLADVTTPSLRTAGDDPAASARLTTCERLLEGLEGRIAALENTSDQPEPSQAAEVDTQAITDDVLERVRADLATEQAAADARATAALRDLEARIAALENTPDQPEPSQAAEVDAQAITDDVLERVRADLVTEQAAADERAASALRDLEARIAAVEAAQAHEAARRAELSPDLVEAVTASVETVLEDRLAERLDGRLARALEDRLAKRFERLSSGLKDRLAADLPEVMEARLADALGEKVCEATVERAREQLLPALEKELAVAERKAEEATSFALVEMENRITALEGRPTVKWPNTARLAEEVLDRLHGDIDRMAAESASRVLREEIAALMKGLA